MTGRQSAHYDGGATIVILIIMWSNHKESYKGMAVVTVVIPVI